ncbi:MAG: glycosyltransferase family 4 protein [Flavobacteriaceae bacterium]
MPIKESSKIFVDAYLLNKEFQGTKTYIQGLYKEFSRRNPHVTVFLGCFKSDDVIAEYKDFENIHLIFYKNKSRLKRMLFEIPKLIQDYQFDFAHFQYVIPFKRSSRTKYIVTIHDILFNDFKDEFSKSYRLKRNSLFKSSANKCDFLCTVSNYSKQRIEEIYKVKKEVFITPNGVDVSYFESYQKKEQQLRVLQKFKVQNYMLYVSRIEPRKNQQLVVQLLDKLPRDLNLVFIGETTLKNNSLDQEIDKLNDELKKRIYFFNNINKEDLLSFIRGAKVFVYPSKAEGFGIPPLEAAAAGVPVLCSNATAMGDFSFFAPYHINFLNEEEVLLSLQKLLSGKDLPKLNYISDEIKKNYSWEKASSVLESIIRK